MCTVAGVVGLLQYMFFKCGIALQQWQQNALGQVIVYKKRKITIEVGREPVHICTLYKEQERTGKIQW